MLLLLFVALWFILGGDLFYVLPCVILFLCFSVLLALRSPRLGKRELILVLFVRLFDLRLSGFVCFCEGLRFVIVALPGIFSYLFFIGLASYYKKIYQTLQSFANLCISQQDTAPVLSGTINVVAFNTVKQLLTTAPILSYSLIQGKPFLLDCDVSNVGAVSITKR